MSHDAQPGREQDGVAGARERGGGAHDVVHGSSVGAVDLDHGDIGRVSRERLADPSRGPRRAARRRACGRACAARARRTPGPWPCRRRSTRRTRRRAATSRAAWPLVAFESSTQRDAVDRAPRRRCGARPARTTRRPVAHRRGRDAVGPGQRRGGERVGDVVRRERVHVVHRRELLRVLARGSRRRRGRRAGRRRRRASTAPGTPRVKPIARQPSTTSASSTMPLGRRRPRRCRPRPPGCWRRSGAFAAR